MLCTVPDVAVDSFVNLGKSCVLVKVETDPA